MRSFEHYGRLSDALCSLFVVDAPRDMLSHKHNGNQSVPAERRWADYFTALNGDGSELLTEVSSNLLAALARRAIETGLEWIDGSAGGLEEQFERAADAGPFVWVLSAYYFAHGTTKHVPELWSQVDAALDACPPVRFRESSLVATLAEDFLNMTGPIATVHVRRTDNVARCNSSVPMVVNKIECDLRHESALPRTLVLFTDEIDPAYLGNLKASLEAAFVPGRFERVHYGDARLQSLVAARRDPSSSVVDNYLVYEVSLAVRRRAHHDLDIDRHKHCTKCSKR